MKPRISCVRYWGARWVFCLDKRNGAGDTMRVEMFDMFGRDISVETHGRASLPSPRTTVNTSGIPSGVYVLRVTLRDGAVRTVKVVKR